jgi:hypothetical protein
MRRPEPVPVAPEQRSAAEDSWDHEAQHESSVQVDPEHHQQGQQPQFSGLQTFSIENDAEQHRRDVRRCCQVGVGCSLVCRIQKGCREDRDANRERRRPGPRAGGRQIQDDQRAACDDQADETTVACVLEYQAGDNVPQPGQVEPLLGAERERPGVLERNLRLASDQVTSGQMPAEIVVTEDEGRVGNVEYAQERDQERVGAQR